MIRHVEARDSHLWAAMRGRLWPHADADELTRETEAFSTGSAETILAVAFIAENAAATPVGFVELSVRPFSDGCETMPVPHVEGWFVEPWARGRGIGRELMAAAQSWARAQGFTELASDTEVHNDESLHAHQSCGFEEVERLIKFRKLL